MSATAPSTAGACPSAQSFPTHEHSSWKGLTGDQIKLAAELFVYDPDTGSLVRSDHPAHRADRRLKNAVSFNCATQYGEVYVWGEHFRAHRLVWALYYGVWPSLPVDHINRVRSDNRIANLRLAEKSQNLANQAGHIHSSAFKGVGFHKRVGKWNAFIGHEGRKIHLGYFDNEADAAMAHHEASMRIYGEFAPPALIGRG